MLKDPRMAAMAKIIVRHALDVQPGCKVLIDALDDDSRGQVAPLPQTHTLLDVSGTQVASVLQANRQTLVRQDMVKKGKTRQEAEAGIDMLITLLKCVDRAELSIGTENDLTQAALKLKLDLPKP